MPEFTLEQIKAIPPGMLLRLINGAKKFLKTNKVFQEMCKEHRVSVDIIDLIPMRFGDIDVSAKTDHGVIILNYKLLCNGDFFKNYDYIIHESLHFIQQTLRDNPVKGADEGDYLSNKFEQDSFKYQVQYLDDMYGEKEADDYVNHLLDYHDKDGKERKKLEKTLKEKIQ